MTTYPRKNYLPSKMYFADHAFSICKPQASVSPLYRHCFPPLGTHRKIQSWVRPQTTTQVVWVKRGVSIKMLVWIPANVGAVRPPEKLSEAVQHGTRYFYFHLGWMKLNFLWAIGALQLPFFPSIWVSYGCRFPVLVSYREKLCSWSHVCYLARLPFPDWQCSWF